MSKLRRHQKQVDAAILDAWSANKRPSDRGAWPLARHVSRTGIQICPRAPSNPGHRGFHRSRRSVPGSRYVLTQGDRQQKPEAIAYREGRSRSLAVTNRR
jgi:hypothetical protein